MAQIRETGQRTGCSETTFWLVEGAAGLEGCCMATVLGFQEFSWVWASAGLDLKKLKLNMVIVEWKMN